LAVTSRFGDLVSLLPGAEVLVEPDAIASFGYDHLGFRGVPGAVVRPSCTEDVSKLLSLAAERGFAVVPRAAATNLCGAFAPHEQSVVIDMMGMSRVLQVDAEALRADVEPGIINGALQEHLAPLGLCYSPDPASRTISTVGGNIACNAGGPSGIKHGVTFHHVHALEVVLPGGRVVSMTDEDPVDLLGLMIGSEGTLGVVTRATVRLRSVPHATWTALVSFARVQEATETVSRIIAERIAASSLELLDRRGVAMIDAWRPSGYPSRAEALLFAEVEGDPEHVEAAAARLLTVLRGADPYVRVASSPEERAALWAGRLGFGIAMVAGGKRNFVNDVTVPRQHIPAMWARVNEIAARHHLDVPIVAHAGDGNVHPVILYDEAEREVVATGASEMTDAALELGGTITGEHGVGVDKIPHMTRRFGPAEIAAFRAIKRAFDPNGVMNPRVMLPTVSPAEPDAARLEAMVAAALGGSPSIGIPCRIGIDAGVAIDEENLTVEVGAAARCEDVRSALAQRALKCKAFDEPGSVGEAVQTPQDRAGVRQMLLAVDAEMEHGRVRFGSAAIKDVAGLDAKRLLTGTGGAFAKLERATFRVTP
jgi:glycolate oxidase